VDLKCRIPAKCAFFHAADERIPKTEDSLAERSGFELSVPLANCDLASTLGSPTGLPF
jgi:hypothetical protein